ARARATPLELTVLGRAVPVELDPFRLAKLLTVDVLRAREAFRATAALRARRSVAGTTVLWAHENSPGDVVVDQRLQAAGATTVELVHAITEIGQQLCQSVSSTTVKAMWSYPEAETLASYRPRQRLEGGFFPRPMPRPIERAPLSRDQPIPVLIAS